jgi:hypothetical protein
MPQGASTSKVPPVELEKLQNEPPLIDHKPQTMALLNSKLMKKYGEEAFLGKQKKNKVKSSSIGGNGILNHSQSAAKISA